MTVVTKTVYIDKLDEIVEKYNKTFHRTIKIKRADCKMVTYFEHDVEVQSGQWCEEIRIWKYFCKGLYSKLMWGKFVIKKSKKNVPWA